jgi:hypothetical protein
MAVFPNSFCEKSVELIFRSPAPHGPHEPIRRRALCCILRGTRRCCLRFRLAGYRHGHEDKWTGFPPKSGVPRALPASVPRSRASACSQGQSWLGKGVPNVCRYSKMDSLPFATIRVRSSSATGTAPLIQAMASAGRMGAGSVDRRASSSSGKYLVIRSRNTWAISPRKRRSSTHRSPHIVHVCRADRSSLRARKPHPSPLIWGLRCCTPLPGSPHQSPEWLFRK